jgi:hypothetical protein
MVMEEITKRGISNRLLSSRTGRNTVWYKFTDLSEKPQICDTSWFLLTFPVLLRCGSCEDKNFVISSVTLKPSRILPCALRNVQICAGLSKKTFKKPPKGCDICNFKEHQTSYVPQTTTKVY